LSEQNRSIVTNAREIDARAAEWIERRDFANWTDADEAALNAWLAESIVHRVAFLRLETGWHSTERLAVLRSVDNSQAMAPREGKWPRMTKIFAAFVVVAALGAAGANYFLRAQDAVYTTPFGGHRIVALADGSVVELNTDTVLRARMSAHGRDIVLEKGEAYFQVKHDAARPFVVLASDHRITDLGTKFVVRSGTGSIEVALVEGRARFESADSSIAMHSAVLTQGDVVVANADSMSVTRKPERELAKQLGWRRGVLVFEYSTLANAAAEFNRYNRRKVVIADADAGRLAISGTFPVNDVTGFADLAQHVLGLRVEAHSGETVIGR
jgi:transmembrane sensor